ncbi:hypothetical protein K491DRAFT_653606 [Lophiostoma macrostomum CBS 122681]|uniref:Nucleoporin Nup159/Nup146 N-terminal domain-containing protein n=1 Tax=Lophiostoma macrostomum CBS 122681 TaxID=1314788 RepID=A0A6A6TEI0_9PLEO|nr:hypothetical protein K491DRAFT_653606 [Lophiostoma macrostomum CBS 122681]
MAFHSNNAGGGAQSVNASAELPEIRPEVLGFSAIGGDKKVRLLPQPWPLDNLPSSSASLLSVASNRGLIAAAGPESLVLAHTDSARKAFSTEAGENSVVSDFTPDVVTRVPQLRHVAFSSDEDFLVITAEEGGGLAVYAVQDLLAQKTDPGVQIATESTAVRALVPNPNPELGHFFAAVLDSGRLGLADVAKGQIQTMVQEGVSCVAFSTRGRALIAGMHDGSARQYKVEDASLMATIPSPPDVGDNYTTSGIYWMTDNEFYTIHSPKEPASGGEDAMQEEQDTTYNIIKADRARTSFTFHKAPMDLCFRSQFEPQRPPPLRFTVNRLRNWEPDLTDMLILGASNSIEFTVLTKTSAPIAPGQEVVNDYTLSSLLDNRKAELPMDTRGEESVLIGEALDLSSKDKVLKPIPTDDEYRESSTPLPAFLALSYEGLLSAWWVVYDKSIRAGTGYSGLTANASDQPATPGSTISAPQSDQANSMFNKPSATFGTPSTPSFGTPGLQTGQSLFGKPSQPAFGTPSAFGAPSAFGKPSQPASGAQSPFGKPSQPAFGAASTIGMSGGTAFGAAGGLGNRPSAWGSPSQSSTPQKPNPFASQAGTSSGFAKFGEPNKSTPGSTFSSFGSVGGQSPLASLVAQNSGFSGMSNEPSAFGGKALSTAPSFGSTVTVGSSIGDGSTLPPSWGTTPAQQSGATFGPGTASFASSKESDMSDASDAQNRERDEATPTPQAPPPQSKGLFGLNGNGFTLTPSFTGDGTAKDDLPKPPAPSNASLFGEGFASALGASPTKPPATPIKKEEEEPRLEDISTTPATLPKPTPSNIFPSGTPMQQPPAPSPADETSSPAGEDAPLPPDPMTWKPPKSSDDELPPLAGSPAIKVEAPESDVPSSPLEDSTGKEDDFSVEEQDGDDEDEEPSPSDAARRPRPQKAQWSFQDSTTQSPRILPAAPTPPAMKSSASSRSGDQSRDTSRPPSRLQFGQASKTGPSGLFQPSATPAGFPKPPTTFAPPAGRAQDSLRSPSPVRAASTSAIGTRRQQIFPHGTPLSASIQQAPKPPTPQPEVSDLSDDEDERIRQELASEIVPSRELEAFIARQDYTGAVSKTGTAAQIEIMYRDMNSMVDTLGLNSRSLESFIKFHQQRMTLGRTDLDEVIDQGDEGAWYGRWSLAAAEDLGNLVDQLEDGLDEGRVQDFAAKFIELDQVLLGDVAKLQTKLNIVRRELINRKHPEKTEALRKASLPKELADQQKASRQDYAQLLSLLNQAEEAAFLLKSKLSGISATNGKPTAVPTVDAVKKTITRLIQMTEKKNNDILLLESQLRKLNLDLSASSSRPTSSSSRTLGTPLRSSRALVRTAQSPLTTPRSKLSLAELNRTVRTPEHDDTPSKGYGLFYTPEGSPTQPGSQTLVALGSRIENGDMTALREANARRKEVAKKLMDAVGKRGVKVTKVAQ